MKRINNLVLTVIKSVLNIILCILVFGGIALVFSAIALLTNIAGVRSELMINLPNQTPSLLIVLSWISAIVILLALSMIVVSVKRIVMNIKATKYFVTDNVQQLYWIMISFLVFIITKICSNIIFSLIHTTNVSDLFDISWINIGVYLLIMTFLYVIYLVFDYGVKLQEDSDGFI